MIRKAKRDDILELSELWARAFPGERTVEQRMSQMESGGVFGGVETAWIDEERGRAVGAFRAFALTQHMHGATWPMMGLAAVAVDETARRRGVARRLCAYAVEAALERGDVLSVLYPFRPAFYEALGWGIVGELHVFRFRPEALRIGAAAVDGTDAGAIMPVRRATAADAPEIAACYEHAARRSNGMLQRNQRIWRHHLDADGVHVFVAGEDGVRGYIIVRFSRGGVPDERPMYIRELVADDSDAYDALLHWVSLQRDSCRLVHYEASPDELFTHRLDEPRPPGYHNTRNLWAPVSRVIRGPMLRLLDVQAALQGREQWGPSAPLRFGLEIVDELVERNDGSFVVEFDGARVTMKRGSCSPSLRLPVSVLSQIHAGELCVRQAVALGRAAATGDVAAIDGLFRADRCFRLLDEF